MSDDAHHGDTARLFERIRKVVAAEIEPHVSRETHDETRVLALFIADRIIAKIAVHL